MAGDSLPPVPPELQQPPKLDDLLKQDRGDDCMSCRIMGGGAFIGLAAYTYFSGQAQLQARQAEILKKNSMIGLRTRSLGITGLSLALAYLGLWRLVK